MNSSAQLIEQIDNGKFNSVFSQLYGKEQISQQRQRYIEAIQSFTELFGEKDNLRVFSAPGRTEIGGNHTDHNHGRILAGSVSIDVIAIVSQNESGIIRIKSKGFDMDTVDTSELEINKNEYNKSIALIRGISARFKEMGLNIGGFDAYTTSDVLKGSGLSSSAAFEVLVGRIMSGLYNNSEISSVEIAKIAQYSENVYFGKPSGLLDQMASSAGGIITVDFKDNSNPVIEKVDSDFEHSGYALCIVDTGGNHADLTNEYSAIPNEMKLVANKLNVDFLRETDMESLIKSIPKLRPEVSDRAILRAVHFLQDDARVVKQVAALKAGDFEEFKRLIIESGNSSYKYLQNVYAAINVEEQGVSLALCLAEMLLEGRGAWRVHGGGFGGTTQNFVPLDLLDEFKTKIEAVFGEGSCYVLSIRQSGGTELVGE